MRRKILISSIFQSKLFKVEILKLIVELKTIYFSFPYLEAKVQLCHFPLLILVSFLVMEANDEPSLHRDHTQPWWLIVPNISPSFSILLYDSVAQGKKSEKEDVTQWFHYMIKLSRMWEGCRRDLISFSFTDLEPNLKIYRKDRQKINKLESRTKIH